MSKRRNQLNAALQRAIQQVIARGLNDPRIRGLITVTGVELREDLRTAKVSVSVLPEERESATIHGLCAASLHVRHEIADLISMPNAPKLEFVIDRSLKTQAQVIETINKGLEGLRTGAAGSAEDDDTETSEGSTA
ncbi:MAG: 30S ribosome-binding factor RbfA [Phycisphaeraceae bacterium]|nr:30S ribosome-binding factor RbfA [Phycisphaeraceae bacterium]